MSRPDTPRPAITRLIGVYDADSTLHGEVLYWLGARLGRRHCSLCDITHGSVRKRPEWTACVASLPIPFETFHRNDQPAEVRSASGDTAPAVVAVVAERHVMLLGPSELDACAGSVDELMAAIARRAIALDLDINLDIDLDIDIERTTP